MRKGVCGIRLLATEKKKEDDCDADLISRMWRQLGVGGIFILGFLFFPDFTNAQNRPANLGDLITIIRYQNSPCKGVAGDEGTCLSDANDCERRKGTNIGTCARGLSTCCLSKFTCGDITSQNETVFVNRNYPNQENGTDTCQVTIEKPDNVCQLRLDMHEFFLSEPDDMGLCTTDSFMVRTTVGERLPILCGENKGQHLYVDMGRGSGNPVVLSVVSNGDKMSRRWKIKISMIECGSLNMAPAGCLQYFRNPSDVVRSFNYGPRAEGQVRYLSNLRYTSCVRVEENFCSIKWETESPGAFSWGAPHDGGASGSICNEDDFIGIDQGSEDGMGPGEDRFCGTKLHDRDVLISRSKPFMLRVKSNSDASVNANNSQYGFSLRYTQLPCMI
ncbi:CUB domain-containing protein [Trichonephila inaurata madagascariensis]|uniref:CUB domain-containing protein n=1 Tax=Trichonephila inaurata madagascariensis TaxID=2747483 RepID=A0A8X6XPR8_9ARAC|nr:CUB domain-containing protein [Trichonephila inaurata madagascariensis]